MTAESTRLIKRAPIAPLRRAARKIVLDELVRNLRRAAVETPRMSAPAFVAAIFGC